jgi:hypothetical protein
MRDRAEVNDGRLLPPVCTEAQGSDSEQRLVQNSKGYSSEST